MSSGGVFTENLQVHYNLNVPILMLCFIYLPLIGYLIFYYRDLRARPGESRISIKWFALCAVLDVHATMLIVYAYEFTSITSVMLLQDFTIPCVVLMSIFFLKLKYKGIHFIALGVCACGLSLSIYNDLFVKAEGQSQSQNKSQLIGDLMSLMGAFGYALINILQEHFL